MSGKKNGNTREIKKIRNNNQIFEGHRISCAIHGNAAKANTNPLSVESNFKGPLYFRVLKARRTQEKLSQQL